MKSLRSISTTLATAAVVATAWLGMSSRVSADARTKAAQEAAEAIMQRFGRQVAKDGAAALAQKLETYAARYGEEALVAARRVGPEVFAAVEAAGADGVKAVRMLARYGEEGATCVLRRPKAMAQFIRYGDEAAAVLVKHPGVAEPLVERGGAAAITALGAVSQRNGRRLAMLAEGELSGAAASKPLLDVLGKYGDRAAEFVWANKGALTVGTALTAFIANPELFLSGAKDITKIAAESVVKPMAEGVANGTNWTLVILAIVGIITAVLAVKLGLFHRKAEVKDPPASSKK